MIVIVPSLLCALLLAQSAPPPTQAAQRPLLEPDGSVLGVLEPGREARYAVGLPEEGVVTVLVDALEFEARLRAAGAEGDPGPAPERRLVLRAPGEASVELVVSATDGRGGRFLLTSQAGHVPPADEPEAEWLERVYGRMAELEQAAGRPAVAHKLTHALGDALFQRAEFAAAGPAYGRALALAEQLGNARGAAAARAFLGACERRVGSLDEGLALLEQAWAQRGALGVPVFDCFLLENLGEARFARGETEAALAHYEHWAARAEELGATPYLAMARSRCGRAQAELGRMDEAQASHERALSLLEQVDDPYLAAQVLIGAGQLAEKRARFIRAQELYEQAAPLTKTWDVELTLQVQLGNVLVERGRYGPAKACLERARSLLGDRERPDVELPLKVNLAKLALQTGDVPTALRLSEQALELAVARSGLDQQVHLLTFVGMAQEQLEAYEEAGATYARALELCQDLDDPLLESRVLSNEGRMLRRQGRHEQALARHRMALELANQRVGDTERAAALSGIARESLTLGDVESAEHHALVELAILRLMGRTDIIVRSALLTLARVALTQGQLSEAEALLDEAHTLIERDDIVGLGAFEAAGVRSGFTEWGELAQDLVARRLVQPGTDRQAWVTRGFREAARWKGRALLEGLPVVVEPQDVLSSLRQALGERRTLVEYVQGSQRLFVYVLGADALELVDLGPLPGLDVRVEGLLSGMTDPGALATAEEIARDGASLYESLLAPVVALLDDDITGLVVVPTPGLARLPLEALVMGVERNGEGVLTFADLRFVADRYHLTYGPSTFVLARLEELGPRRDPGRMLVLGDPVYASENPRLARSGREAAPYQRLPETKGEVLAIARSLLATESAPPDADTLARLLQLESERSGALESSRFDLYFGHEATAKRLLGDLQEYAILHIAAHGEVDPREPLRTGLVLSYDGIAHDHVTLHDIQELRLDADLVVLSACDTARGRVLRGEGVQSLASAFLGAGSRAVVASLWSVEDSATRHTMAGFYASLLPGESAPDVALAEARALHDHQLSVRRGEARGKRLGAVTSTLRGDPGHPYYWAPFIWVGAIP